MTNILGYNIFFVIMEKNIIEKEKFLGFYYIGYFVFIISIVLITFFENPYIISFALIAFFFIPGSLLIASIKPTKIRFNPIELMLISFGLSLILIVIITYFLILIGIFIFIYIVYIFLTTTSLIWLIIRYKILRNNSNQKNFDNSFRQKISFLIKEEKELFIILILTIFFFFFCFFLKQYDMFRFPDEYFYLSYSNQDLIQFFYYRQYRIIDFHFIISSVRKLGFFLELSFYFTLAGTTYGVVPHVLLMMFYSLLIPVTYLIGAEYNKKTGIIAALFIVSNPLVWFWSSRVMPDISYTVISTSFFYFFYKSFKKRGKISSKYLVPTMLFGFLAYTQQPKIIFFWAVPFAVYFLSSLTKKNKHYKKIILIIILSIICLIFFIILLTFIAPWFFEFDVKNMLESLLSIFKFSLQDWIYFFSEGGTFWDIIGFPYYFSHAVIILLIVGAVVFIKTRPKRESFLFIFSILFTLYFHSTHFYWYDARFSLIIYPLLMVFAAIAFSKNLGYTSLFLIAFLFLLFPFNPLDEPGTVLISPPIGILIGTLSRIIGLLLIIYMIYEGIKSKSTKIKTKFNKKFRKITSIFVLISILSSSIYIGNFMSTNENYPFTQTPEELGLPQAGEWILMNIPRNSIIITNARAQILNYFSDYSFNTKDLKRDGFGWIITPKAEELSSMIEQGNFDYMVIFSAPVVAELGKRQYFRDYINRAKKFTVYKYNNYTGEPILINECNSTLGWRRHAGNITFSLDSLDKISGNNSMKISGYTAENRRTRISFAGSWNFSGGNYLDFYMKITEITDPSYFSVILSDNQNNLYYWDNTNDLLIMPLNEWNKVRVNLFNPKGYEGDLSPDMNEITRISIYIYATPNSSINYNLDYFQFDYTLVRTYYEYT